MLVAGSMLSPFSAVALGVRSALAAGSGSAEARLEQDTNAPAVVCAISFGGASEASKGASGTHEREYTVPVIRGGAAGRSEGRQRISSVAVTALAQLVEDSHIDDVLVPDQFMVAGEETGDSAWFDQGTGVSGVILDEQGDAIEWPWQDQAQRRHASSKSRRHRALDRIVVQGLMHASAKGDMGANSTGVRRWKAFCASEGIAYARALEAHAPLRLKLTEEWLCMRFIASLVETGSVSPSSAAAYFGQVQGWHAKEYGVKLASGMKLNRLPQMLKGLRRTMGEEGRRVRRGVSPQDLKAAMDKCLDPSNVVHANIRAAVSLAFQGLLRGAEFAVDGKFSTRTDMTRADIASISAERLVVMMRPCKNMQHLSGKTVPLIIGAGGTYVDAVAEMANLARVDPVSDAEAPLTPMFRQEGGAALTTRRVREWTAALVASIGLDPSQFGAHSYRIGGATALFAAGAEPTIIRTMGRWSSDCYRLYVRACFKQTLNWSRICGSQEVHDVAAEFEEVDSY